MLLYPFRYLWWLVSSIRRSIGRPPDYVVFVLEETLPALRRLQKQGKVRFVGISGYPMNIFRYVLERAELDVVLSYNHYTLQNTMLADLVPYLKSKGVGIMNAAPFSARLLTNAPLPVWHKATPEVRAICRRAAGHCPTCAAGYR